MKERDAYRENLLDHWARLIIQAAHAGALTRRPIQILSADTIQGPRAGVLEIHAGTDTGRLLRALAADDAALARQFVPWHFSGDPAVFLSSRYVRVEAGWSPDLTESDIKLRDLEQSPPAGRWIAGMNEAGNIITMGFNNSTPHILLAGTTGSGKTEAIRAAIVQLADSKSNQLVILDGKWGGDLGDLRRVPGLVGPLATTAGDIRAALAWVIAEMQRRYELMAVNGATNFSRLIIMFDEFQEFTNLKKGGDPAAAEMLRQIVNKGRGARVYSLLATHHPTVDTFGGEASARRSIPGRMALLVTDFDASMIAVGDKRPHAHKLLGRGDAYCITPTAVHRAQLARADAHDLRRLPQAEPGLECWPAYNPEVVGMAEKTPGWNYSADELAASLTAAAQGYGRPRLVRVLEKAGLGRPGSERAARLLALGREAHAWLEKQGWTLVQEGATQ
ncbi:MAG: FtsK/SpoIIIE domain-containing protein [Anaerolineae bacterium]|jgi:hypothetical protein